MVLVARAHAASGPSEPDTRATLASPDCARGIETILAFPCMMARPDRACSTAMAMVLIVRAAPCVKRLLCIPLVTELSGLLAQRVRGMVNDATKMELIHTWSQARALCLALLHPVSSGRVSARSRHQCCGLIQAARLGHACPRPKKR